MYRSGTEVWKEIPFIRIIIPFCAGILCSFPLKEFVPYTWIVIPVIFIFFRWVQRLPAWKAWNWRFIQGLALNLLIYIAGFSLPSLQNESFRKASLLIENDPLKIFLLAQLEEPAFEKKNRFRATVTLFEILPGQQKKVLGRAILYFPPNKKMQLPYGSMLLIKTVLRKMQKKGNPGQFDYAAYFERQGIYFQIFLLENDFRIIPLQRGASFSHYLFKLRDKIISIIQTYIPDQQASGLAEALLIGYRNDLDQRLMTAYTNTGVVHVIAISGLHLGLLFSVFMSISGGESRRGKKKWIQLLIIIPVLWIFSFLAGGSASVIRSACMFTMIGIGQLTGKKGNSLNTLFATAFLLLCYKPDWIFDIGFQLSFAAVGSILVYYPWIKNIFHFTNPIARKCSDLIAVTVAAQILTTPLILFYFKQFPLLFLLTNLFAVPLSGWILLGELCLVVGHFWDGLASLLGDWIEKAIILLNDYVLRMEQIPFSVIRNIYLSLPEVILLLSLIGFLSWWIKSNIKSWFMLSMISMLFFSGVRLYQKVNIAKQQNLVIVHIPGQRVILLVKGSSGTILFEDADSWAVIEKELQPLMQYFRLREVIKKSLPAKTTLVLEWEGKRFFLVGSDPYYFNSQDIPSVDLCVISHNPTMNLPLLKKQILCPVWVADGTNKLWKIQEWKKAAELLHLRFHSTSESGAFLHDFTRNGPAIYPSNPGFTPD